MSKFMHFILFLFLFQLAAAPFQYARTADRRGAGTQESPHVLPQADGKIKIDGKLNEPAWKKALKLPLPYETWPGENTPAPVETECYITHTHTHLYVGFRAHDPRPSKIRAYYFDRDKIYYDDFVMVFLDTFNDERRAYGFRSNPLGVQADDIRTRQGASQAWDAIYESAGKIYDWGYEVEMAIPFNQLRFQRTRGEQVWGINARRIYPRDALFHLDSVKLERGNNCMMCQYIKIKGLEGARPGRNIEVVPTVTAHRTEARENMPDGPMEKESQKVEGGLTVRWGITPNMTMSGAINPDYSQVEADSLQLDLNQPFALFYEERRPFFYEGAEYFKTNFSAVYTRAQREPEWGIKLTGKTGGSTVGAYIVRDELTNLIFPGSHGSANASLSKANTSSVLRYKHDFGRNVTVGGLLTARDGDDYYNRVYGLDMDLRLSRSDRLEVQYLRSSTRYPDEVVNNPMYGQTEGEFGGGALDIVFKHATRHWNLSAGYRDVAAGFRADQGYMPQVDYRKGTLSAGYTWSARRRTWYRQLELAVQGNYTADQDGDLITGGGDLVMRYVGPKQTDTLLRIGKHRETLAGQEFDQLNASLYAEMKPTGNMEFAMTLEGGDCIDYDNVRLGKRITMMPQFIFKPNRHMRMELSHIYERLNVDSRELYTANITQMTAVYHMNVRTYIRAILQYVNYGFNTENYLFQMMPELKRLNTQLLFTYKLNPRTVLYLGYSDQYHGNSAYRLTQNSRTLFAKISYAMSL
jgi:hypothetical protein